MSNAAANSKGEIEEQILNFSKPILRFLLLLVVFVNCLALLAGGRRSLLRLL
jgi:hypothetical protein